MSASSDKRKVRKILKAIKFQAKAPLRAASKTEYIEKQAKKMSKKMTWPEKEFVKLMKQLKISIESQKIVMGKIFDFYEPKSNTLFEIDGNYYHGDREIYEELSSMQRRNVKNDSDKNIIAVALGYKIERIWELDLKNDYKGVRDRVKKLLN